MRTFTMAAFGTSVLFAALTCACDRRSDDQARETRTTGATQETPTVGHVKDDPAQFYGKRVTLTGEVDDVKNGARSFKLEGEGLFGRELRVLTRGPVKMAGAPLSDDDEVTVTGTVRRFVIADVERELGWRLTPEVEIDLRDKPVLVADEIRRVEPSATWSAKAPEGEIVSTVVMITATDPNALAGQHITLTRTKVQSMSGKGMWVGPSHASQTFVLPTGGANIDGIKEGDLVDVRGTVRKTPPAADAVKAWGIPGTLRGVVEAEPLYIEASEIKSAGGGAQQKSDGGAR